MAQGASRLENETSTYLRSAARQPVDWWPWGEDALRRAQELDRPILLDIGASWCHWCHVIDRESYEDPDLARVINDNFVPIKVDRDERPDIDARYQQAVGSLTGQGGWPLTAFLTPEGKVFYGGTYFPPEDSYNRPSFRRVLLATAKHYRESKDEALRDAEALHRGLVESPRSVLAEAPVNEGMLRAGLETLRHEFDPVNGGFGGAPKFPHPGTIEWLMAHAHRTGSEVARKIATRTLLGMARGGVYDHVGGGFHRYSTDGQWIVPHFEKMLYDNAGLLANYVHAWQLAGVPLFRATAEGILAWAREILSDPARGGFYASQDADVGLDDDGDYFTWTLEELRAALPADEAAVIAATFDVRERGEMRHNPAKNVLYVDQEPEGVASALGIPGERVRELIALGMEHLKKARDVRPAPGVDRTIYAGWNGMMISSTLEAAIAFRRDDLEAFALKTLDRILTELWTDTEGMWHALAEGERKVKGLLEDHVFVIDALLEAFLATGDRRRLDRARAMMDFTLTHFWDERAKGFLDLAPDLHARDGLPLQEIRRRPIDVSPFAGANAVAALCLQRLYALTGNDAYRLHHDELMMSFAGAAARYGPLFTGTYHLAAELWVHPPPEIVIFGPLSNPAVEALTQAAQSTYAPGRTVLVTEAGDVHVPEAVEAKRRTPEAEGGPVAFVCMGRTCSPPTSDPEQVRALLRGQALGV